jgi:hypothetical protein
LLNIVVIPKRPRQRLRRDACSAAWRPAGAEPTGMHEINIPANYEACGYSATAGESGIEEVSAMKAFLNQPPEQT